MRISESLPEPSPIQPYRCSGASASLHNSTKYLRGRQRTPGFPPEHPHPGSPRRSAPEEPERKGIAASQLFKISQKICLVVRAETVPVRGHSVAPPIDPLDDVGIIH